MTHGAWADFFAEIGAENAHFLLLNAVTLRFHGRHETFNHQ